MFDKFLNISSKINLVLQILFMMRTINSNSRGQKYSVEKFFYVGVPKPL